MALHKCAECGRRISSKASVCPGCGAPAKRDGAGQLFGLGIGLIALLLVACVAVVVLAILGAPLLWVLNNPLIGWVLVIGGLVYAVWKRRRKLGFGLALLGALLLVPYGTEERRGEGLQLNASLREPVNLRSGPGTEYSVVRVLKEGEQVQVGPEGEDGEWIPLLGRQGQIEGYVLGDYLIFQSK